ncbi:Uncharacterized protein SCF082_LOCUS28204, partial [Durusdinium trenchii]
MGDAKGGSWVRTAAVLAAVAVAARVALYKATEVVIPEHLLGKPAVYVPQLFGNETQRALLDLLVERGEIPSNSADTSFYKTLHEHIGEAQPIEADGTCSHPYLMPNQDRTLCILPGRIDIARAFALTGGFNGIKENLSGLFSRLLSFGIYLFNDDVENNEVIRSLFNSPEFVKAAKQVCPPNKQHLDPFQFNFIVQIPSQTVPTHLDGVYFKGATRFEYPQWLLAVMKSSGVFEDRFVDQVQVVGYLSDWDREATARTPSKFGEFIFWDKNGDRAGRRMPPLPRSGNAIDGSKVIHTTSIYRPDALAKYSLQDLRISIVYRGRCFRDQDEATAFRDNIGNAETAMKLDDILEKLVSHGKALASKAPPPLEHRLDLAMWLLDTYIAYPYPDLADVWMPFNF